jgi:hypothetical protein
MVDRSANFSSLNRAQRNAQSCRLLFPVSFYKARTKKGEKLSSETHLSMYLKKAQGPRPREDIKKTTDWVDQTSSFHPDPIPTTNVLLPPLGSIKTFSAPCS